MDDDKLRGVLQTLRSHPPGVLETLRSLPAGLLQKLRSLPPERQIKFLLGLPPVRRKRIIFELLADDVASLPPGLLQKLPSLPPDVLQKLPPEQQISFLFHLLADDVASLPPGKARETNLQEKNMELQKELERKAQETNLQEKNMELQKELEQRQLKSAQLQRKIKEQEINLEEKKSRSAQLQQKIKEQEIKLKQPGRLLCYSMSRRPRGICVIINNINFRGEVKRVGAEFDESELVRLFKELQFEVHPFRDLQWDEMRKKAVDFSKKDHSQFDAFAFIVMSHGGDKDVISGVNGRLTRVEDLMTEFKAANCPTLGNKPKLFIIQACRGSSNDSLSPASCGSDTATEFSPDSTLTRSVCPQEADFLLSFATAPGYKSWRYPGFGTPYIQFLVEEIRKHHHSHHLLDILTEVNGRVVEEGIRHGKAIQCPAPTHTLQGQVFL